MKHYILLDQVYNSYYADVNEYRIIDMGYKFKNHCDGYILHGNKCGLPLRNLEWLPPYVVNISNRKLADILFGAAHFLVSERFKLAYESSGLVGLTDFREVKVNYKRAPIEDKYYYPEVPAERHLVDLSMFKENKNYEAVLPITLCGSCQGGLYGFGLWYERIKGIKFLNPEKIDKDIFELPLIAELIISERFKEFVEKYGFTNFNIVELSKYRYDIYRPVKYEKGEMFYDPEYVDYTSLLPEELSEWVMNK